MVVGLFGEMLMVVWVDAERKRRCEPIQLDGDPKRIESHKTEGWSEWSERERRVHQKLHAEK